MNLRSRLSLLLLGAIAVTPLIASAQQAAPQAATPAQPAFEVISIKPYNPDAGNQPIGFYSYPGGRVVVNAADLKMLLYFAYDVKDYQIAGDLGSIGSERYTIVATPPDTSPSREQKVAPFKITPTDEQRQMIQALLRDRFGLRLHRKTKVSEVYILSRGKNPLQLQPPADSTVDSRGGIVFKSGGIVDGEATGINVTMHFLAGQLSRYLGLPVLDQTGLTGSYDYHLPPTDPQNTDVEAAIFDAMHRLGLDLKKGKGPIETVVIDHVEKPAEN
jgi:uncharacterized protein (TIGR03435 family)